MLNEQWRRKYGLLICVAGIVVFLVSGHFGSTAVFLVGLPILFIACGIAAGARTPSSIPNRDALIYVGIGVLIVAGVVLYALYSR
jgi:cytochrome c biogenesis protein CcdA